MTRIIVADTETTGMDPATDRVVEYAHTVVTDDFGKLGGWHVGPLKQTLIDPCRDIPPEAKAIHHITEKDVYGKPTIDLAMLGPDITYDVEQATHLCFHNAQFDLSFVGRFLPDLPVICTWRCAAHLYPQAPSHKNQVLRYYLDLDLPYVLAVDMHPHRAGYDVLTTATILRHLLTNHGVDELVRLSDPQLPILQWTVKMGKYFGRPWREMDAGYCRWVLGKDFDADVKHTAQYQLDWLARGSDASEWGNLHA